MENLVYWQGRAVGMEANGRITWFAGAPREAIEALS
jgi:hypothetical protein